MDPTFDVAAFLQDRREAVIQGATRTLENRHLPHYEAAGPEESESRITALFDVLVDAARSRRLDEAEAYAERLAGSRQQSGTALAEVQLAINALEEHVWHAVTDQAPAADQGQALGIVSTILGAVKDRLACTWVSQASGETTRTLRLDELFGGTAAGTA